MVNVVHPLCQHDGTSGVIVLESDLSNFPQAIEELNSAETRKMAILAAARGGLPDPRINGITSPHAVDADGEQIVKTTQKIAAYRIEIPVCRRLV